MPSLRVIDTVATELLIRYYLDKGTVVNFPIDPFLMAKKLKLLVEELPKEERNLSGKFSFEKKTIFFNPEEKLVIQRFVVAHEIGHFALNFGKSFSDTNANFERYVLDPDEFAANLFALSLLMPKTPLINFIDKRNITDANRLMEILGVTLAMLEFRCKILGLI